MKINNIFEIGQSVYLKTDSDQHERLVTAIIVRGYGLLYSLSHGTEESTHYDFEINPEKDITKI